MNLRVPAILPTKNQHVSNKLDFHSPLNSVLQMKRHVKAK